MREPGFNSTVCLFIDVHSCVVTLVHNSGSFLFLCTSAWMAHLVNLSIVDIIANKGTDGTKGKEMGEKKRQTVTEREEVWARQTGEISDTTVCVFSSKQRECCQFYSIQSYSITKLPGHICIVTSGLEEQMETQNLRVKKIKFSTFACRVTTSPPSSSTLTQSLLGAARCNQLSTADQGGSSCGT